MSEDGHRVIMHTERVVYFITSVCFNRKCTKQYTFVLNCTLPEHIRSGDCLFFLVFLRN